jgi:hypothetical protein
MPEFDANEALARLPAAGAGEAARPRERPHARRSMAILRYLDVVLVVLAAAPALALGAPVLGYTVGAGAWLAQRIIAEADKRLLNKAAEPRTQFGLSLFEAFGRIWLLAGAIVAAGVIGGRADGLTAAVTIFAAYSIAFAIRVMSGLSAASPAARAPHGSPTTGETQ